MKNATRIQLETLLDLARNDVPFHKRRAPRHHLNLLHWPLMSKHDLAAYPLDESSDLLSQSCKPGGYIVASGGTTTKPKYIFYSHDEAAVVTTNIAKHFFSNGMTPGDRVVNYLPSGDMWSSFLMVDRALSVLPVTIFPLGCTNRMDYSLSILEQFRPNVIVGIPSMIVQLARYTAVHAQTRVRMGKVFYAGEPMLRAMMHELKSAWQCEQVRSAGYASTDVGSIGWQCLHCKTGEHYAFDDTVVEIIEGEIVVTSLMRKCMPMIRYRTGDRGEWVVPSCECGQGSAMFKLLGRLDNVVLIWGCRILFDDIVEAFHDVRNDVSAIQIHIDAAEQEQILRVKFESIERLNSEVEEELRDLIYERCGDLRGSLSRETLDRHILFEAVAIGTLTSNGRTGKMKSIIDLRSCS